MTHYLLVITSIYAVSGVKIRNATRTDITKCKLTQLGTEYAGFKMTTAGGIRCQSWFSENPLHKVNPVVKDKDFPEMSMIDARNYCRNPTKAQKGPWCYTMEPSIIDDKCGIPLCNFGECRVSGIGAEYGGSKKISSSGKECKLWDKRYKFATEKTVKFADHRFPESSRSKADKFCRNPDNSLGGPWCYVEEENFEFVKKEFCDIPFCDDRDIPLRRLEQRRINSDFNLKVNTVKFVYFI